MARGNEKPRQASTPHLGLLIERVCYLRIRSTAETTDEAGMYIKSVKVTAIP